MSVPIYVVMGGTGEYSDREEWPVKAFIEKKDAEQLVVDATKVSKLIDMRDYDARRAITKDTNPFDPNMKMDYTGTYYYIIETELEE